MVDSKKLISLVEKHEKLIYDTADHMDTHLQKPATSLDSTQISTLESRKSYFNRLHRTVYSVFSVKFTERTGDLV